MRLALAILLAFVWLVPANAAPRHGWHDGRGGWGPRWHDGGGYYHNDSGVLGGLIIGGLLGGIFNPAPPVVVPSGPTIEWCMQRYKSYNPETHVYLGFDGQYHGCP